MPPNEIYAHEGRGRAELRARAILINRSRSAEGLISYAAGWFPAIVQVVSDLWALAVGGLSYETGLDQVFDGEG